MGMKTGVIRFNLKKRMREFNGQDRDFDIPKLVKTINSPKVQERVRLGDLNGFYGHWARVQFGAEPQEGGVVDGKFIVLEPCCRTISLKAYADGTVEHEQEFFDTEIGQKAYQRWNAKSGGFSSVISQMDGYDFHGFDYVNEPNYSENRGYVLDSVEGETLPVVMLLDNVKLPHKDNYIQYLLDCVEILEEEKRSLKYQNQLLSESLAELQNHYDVLLDDVVIVKEQRKQAVQNNVFFANSDSEEITLDSVQRKANKFKTAKLEPLPENESEISEAQLMMDNILERYGY